MNRSLLTLAFLLFAVSPAMAQNAQPHHVKIELIAEHNKVQSGDNLWIAVRQTIEPHWHTYWINPGDSGTPPVINWTLPPGFEIEKPNWPAPSHIPYSTLVNFGYSDHVTSLQRLTLPKTLPGGRISLPAKIELLVCNDICVPESFNQTVVLNDPSTADQDNSKIIKAAISALPQKANVSATYGADGPNLIIDILGKEPILPADADLKSLAIFPSEWGMIKNAAPLAAQKISETHLVLRQNHDDRDLSHLGDVPAILSYKTKDGNDAAIELTMIPSAAPPSHSAAAAPAWQAMLFAFLGGLILNLMPCVFPVLSLKALSLVALREKGRGEAVLNGMAYTIGILISFAAIGGALVFIRAAGGDVQWGFQLQNPMVILGLSYLLFVIGLNLSGMFDIGGSFVGVGSSLAQRSGLIGSFFTGVLATLVATPCTAPFMAGALGIALTQSTPVAMAIFMFLGLGLALPYLLLSAVPAFGRLLPKPGLWMVKFKEFLAFPMYVSAVWLVWVLNMQVGPSGIMWALSGMVAIAFAVWILAHRPKNKGGRSALAVTALLARIFAGMPFFDNSVLGMPTAMLQNQSTAAGLDNSAFSQEKLDNLLSSDQPVFVYMSAAWCISCKVNEHVAINTAAIQTLFKDRHVAVLHGDWTNMNPEITKYLAQYGRNGVPLYVYYGPPGKNGKRPDPVILPQILTPGIIGDAIRNKLAD